MIVILFQDRFAGSILTGAKRQTIRPPRKRPIAVGQYLALRIWRGAPYRSPQIDLGTAKATEVTGVRIHHDLVYEGGLCRSGAYELDTFAWADGFRDWAEMREWFAKTHPMPFLGSLIRWTGFSRAV